MSSTKVSSQNGAQEAELPYVDALIIGTGPSGGSLACFLASYGIKGIMVSAASGTADTPRAHITNMAALECLRDIGLEEEVLKLACEGENMIHTRWCHSMAGKEYARIYSWGNDPKRKGDYDSASPCRPVDLPQTLLDPFLARNAILCGYQCRWDTRFVSFVDHGYSVTSTLFDKITQQTYQIRSRYLFGADGARSEILRQLDLPLIKKPSGGLAINILVKADLSHLVKFRMGNLHWVMQPDVEHPDFGWIGIVRMVKPWNEWMFILFPSLTAGTSFQPTQEQYQQRVQEFIGDETPVEILNISKWFINEIVAETYSKGNVYCLGDAVHRHPPFNGLGSNTCIQDAYNLAWKIAYVQKGQADPVLLETYSQERQPVGQSIITRANDGFRDHHNVWKALGILEPTVAERMAVLEELQADSKGGRARRIQFQKAITQTAHEFHGLGIEMGQQYHSTAVYEEDEVTTCDVVFDRVLDYRPSTRPGCRLPHIWLSHAIPSGLISTIDLAGKGKFSLFTGIGGWRWKSAALAVSEELGVIIQTYSIGFGQDFEDVYFDWARMRGVEESGCVLVRPDRFVAWRSHEALGDEERTKLKLNMVMRAVLGREIL